jgi:alpha-amylase/alpha-mannosidase (GH57 family)
MDRFVCIHGHFYQPPRENPWLEAIELQDSAYPYHDWNERVTAECYAPNATTRILDGEDRIVQIVNNYARISFNFGPTLLSWLEEKNPDVYAAILTADAESARRFSGHGSALAQPYNHMILPLASRRDKVTQVRWGIRDFEHRFGRSPEGMWLPETAVDLETLEVLAEHAIRFTILAPHQAARARPAGGEWGLTPGGGIDPTRPYAIALPSGRQMALFFYDEPISRAVAFEHLLSRGEHLAQRLVGALADGAPRPQLVHIATDGETYGHHHRHGDMALAYALHTIEANGLARLTNYGEFLERHPPGHEVEIVENTSWSCAHGVERWRSDCGCSSGTHADVGQAWRAPLREALDALRDGLAPCFEEAGRLLLSDPWQARDGWISVVLDRSPESFERFLAQHAVRPLARAERIAVRKLLELQRHAQLMYTSCGWFFDDLSRIETLQILHYAGRAVELAESIFGEPFEPFFLERLERAKSGLSGRENGRRLYEKFVRPSIITLERVGAHYAVNSLFEIYAERSRVYCYTVEREDYRLLSSGKVRLALGSARVSSEPTEESKRVDFGVLHLGDHNLTGGVRQFQGEAAYTDLVREITEAFGRGDFAEILRVVDRSLGADTYSLRFLFRDEQRKVIQRILESKLAEAEGVHRQLYEQHAPILRYLFDLGVPPPRDLLLSAAFVLNRALRRALEQEEPDLDRIGALVEEAKSTRARLDGEGLTYAFQRTVERLSERLLSSPEDPRLVGLLDSIVSLARTLPLPSRVDFWKVQNACYRLLQSAAPTVFARAEEGDEGARAWIGRFRALAENLGVRVELPVAAVEPRP